MFAAKHHEAGLNRGTLCLLWFSANRAALDEPLYAIPNACMHAEVWGARETHVPIYLLVIPQAIVRTLGSQLQITGLVVSALLARLQLHQNEYSGVPHG